MADESKHFLATIYKIWIMRQVDVPEDIATALIARMHRHSGGSDKKRAAPKHIPVVATVNRKSVQTTLVPAGAGRYRLRLNTALRKAGGADTGDVIGVTLQFDPNSRDVDAPLEYLAALKRNPLANKEFDRLPPGHRRQLLAYYFKVKSPAARTRAIEKTIDHLRERALLRPPASKRSAHKTRRGKHPKG
ncbi:MAG: YdeI/OmpD-associated family protein [Candidatus Acidiferrales bacterium]